RPLLLKATAVLRNLRKRKTPKTRKSRKTPRRTTSLRPSRTRNTGKTEPSGDLVIGSSGDQKPNRSFNGPISGLRDTALSLGQAHDQSSPARQFVIGDFRQELQVEAHPLAFLAGRFVEKVDDVSAKSILGSAAFIEVERAHRIDFDLGAFAQDGAQLALEAERSLPHLRHGERNDPVRHSCRGRIAALPASRAVLAVLRDVR